MGLFSNSTPYGKVIEYIPVPTIDCPGFVMAMILKHNDDEEGCWCCLTKHDEYPTGFSKFFEKCTGVNFRQAAEDLYEYCGAIISECQHAETKENSEIQRLFEYVIFPDLKSFMMGKEWFEARWTAAKLNNFEK